MKKNSLLLWILIPISCMTSYIVYAESVDPLDPGVVVEEPTPTDLIEPDPVPDQTIQDEVPVDVWAPDEPVAPAEEPVSPWEEVPVDSLEPLLDPTGTGTQPIIGGGLQSALGGLQSAILPTTTPPTSTSDQGSSSTSNSTVNTSNSTSAESQIDQPVLTNPTSSNLIAPTSTSTNEQTNSSTSNGTSAESQVDQLVLANPTSSNLIAPTSTGTDEQTNSSTSNQTANTSNSTSAESQTNQPVLANPTSSNLPANKSGTLTENSTQTSSSGDKNKTSTATTQNSSSKNGNTTHSNSSQSNLSGSTRSNNTASKASSTQSKSNVSTTTSTSTTTDNTDSSVQDNTIVTTKQNASTTTDKNPSGNSNLSKGDLSTAPKISSVSSANAHQDNTIVTTKQNASTTTNTNENGSQLSTPKSSPAIANEEGGTTQLNDGVVIVADNSVLPNTFSIDAQIGPHQVFLINIGEGYSKPEIVEHLNNSQVFIKENLLTYVPHLGFVGIDTFSYRVTDPEGKRVVKQVRVKVTAKDELVPVKNCQLYFINDEGDSNSQFLTVAPKSKIAVELGPKYYTFDIEGMAIHPTTGLLYATSGKGKQNIFDGYLYRVNPETGGVTIIGDTGFSEISSLAFRPDGTLWSWARKGSKDKSKPIGLIQIDPTTAQSQLIFASPVDIEGLAWDSEGKVLYGTEQTRLWAFDGKELHQQCSNFSSEVESLETSVNGMLLFGTNEHKGNSIHLYDPAICEEITGDSFTTPSISGIFDIESLAWPLECQSAMTKTTLSETSNVDNQKATRNSKKVTSQPVTTCPSDIIGPCPALIPEEVQRFFTDNLKADFVQLDPDGLLFVSLNEQLHYGFFSYSLSAEQVKKLKLKSVYEVACEKNAGSVAQLKLSLTKDVDGEGHGDFVITYCDGQAQMLFYLGITDSVLTGTDDIETSNKSNSNAIKEEDIKTKQGNSTQTKN